jgi:large subunit ribosomal protein L31
MKETGHPVYFQAKVKCNCGNEFVTGSTKENISVEVCSKCHPFYTGSQKLLLEAGGRVEKFNKKYNM